MIYLSANGEVLGQFEESVLPSLLADGTITSNAFFWRVGMTEWRPVTELAMPPVPEPSPKPALPKLVPAPIAAKPEPTASVPGRKPEPGTTVPASAPEKETRPSPEARDKGKRRRAAVEIRADEAGAIFAAELYRVYRAVAESEGFQIEPVRSVSGERGGFKHVVFEVVGEAETAASLSPEKTQIPPRSLAPVEFAPTKLAIPERRPAPETAAKTNADANRVRAAVASTAGPGLSILSAPKPLSPRTDSKPPGESDASPSKPARPPQAMVAPVPPLALPARRRSWPAVLLTLLFLAAAAGGGTWWWLNRPPAAIPGMVVLSGDETGPVKISLFRRDELAAPWREQLAVAESRAGELSRLQGEAEAELREKTLLYDEAARVCEVGEEFNMPDLDKLRADRDAKKADADAAQAKVDQAKAEKEGLLAVEALLESTPAPLQTLAADAQGNFSLPAPAPEAGEIVVLATSSAEADGRRQVRGWLEILAAPRGGESPQLMEFSEVNRLDLEAVRNFVGSSEP